MSNLIGTVKSINSTKAGNLIVECIDNQQYKTLLKLTHLGEWVIKVYVPKSMNTSIGCIYNVPLDITEEEIKDVLKQQNVSNCVRLTYYDKEKKKKDRPPILSNYILMFLNSLLEYPLVLECTKLSYLYPDPFNVLIANSLVTCSQTVASPECVVNVVNSMKINNVRLINQNVPTVKENTPLVVKLAQKK